MDDEGIDDSMWSGVKESGFGDEEEMEQVKHKPIEHFVCACGALQQLNHCMDQQIISRRCTRPVMYNIIFCLYVYVGCNNSFFLS